MRRFLPVLPALTVLTVLLSIALFPAWSAADTVEIQAIRDNTLFQDAEGDTSNGAGTGVFCGRNSQGRIRRGLLAFDLRSALPSPARLDSAILVLRMSTSSDVTPRVLSLHRVLADWGEGGSVSGGGGGAPAQAGDATWLHTFYPSVLWSTVGGDFAPASSASITVPEAAGDYAWRSATLTGDVQGWIEQGATNFGWILVGDESVPNTARRFDSRESTTPATRPRLVLHYSVETPALPTSWGRVKTLYR